MAVRALTCMRAQQVLILVFSAVALRVLCLDVADHSDASNCEYCMSIDDISTPVSATELTARLWEDTYGLTGRAVLVNLTDPPQHFSFSDVQRTIASVTHFSFRNAREANSSRADYNRVYQKWHERKLMRTPPPRGDHVYESATNSWIKNALSKGHGFFKHALSEKYDWYMHTYENFPSDEAIEWLDEKLNLNFTFLPSSWEASTRDGGYWFFFGTVRNHPFLGNDWHIDNVNGEHGSTFHVQLSGVKQWVLKPVPQCQDLCGASVTVTVHPGQFLSLNTDKWYHTVWLLPQGDTAFTLSVAVDLRPPRDGAEMHEYGHLPPNNEL